MRGRLQAGQKWAQAEKGLQVKVGYGWSDRWRWDLWVMAGSVGDGRIPRSDVVAVTGEGTVAGEFQAGLRPETEWVRWPPLRGPGRHSWGQAHRGTGAMAAAVGWALL